MNGPWGLRIPILPDELLSSWLVRAALTFGCDPLVLTGQIWPEWRVWTQDPDRGLTDDRLHLIAQISGVSLSDIENSTLRFTALQILGDTVLLPAVLPWILPLGSRNRSHSGGTQYCPQCLLADPKPYYRRSWRFAWHTVCPIHSVVLVEHCPDCGAALEPSRLEATDSHLAKCARCNGDLRNAVLDVAQSSIAEVQEMADKVLKSGQGTYGDISLSPRDWFALVRFFVRLLRRCTLGQPVALRSFIRRLGVDSATLVSPDSGLSFELLPVSERAQLIADAGTLLKAGPGGFKFAANVPNFGRQTLFEPKQTVPVGLETLVRSLPEKRRVQSTRSRTTPPRPRSRQSVLRMWSRLLRKLNRTDHQ